MMQQAVRRVPASEVQPGRVVHVKGGLIEVDSVTRSLEEVTIAGRPPGRRDGRRRMAHFGPDELLSVAATADEASRLAEELAVAVDGSSVRVEAGVLVLSGGWLVPLTDDADPAHVDDASNAVQPIIVRVPEAALVGVMGERARALTPDPLADHDVPPTLLDPEEVPAEVDAYDPEIVEAVVNVVAADEALFTGDDADLAAAVRNGLPFDIGLEDAKLAEMVRDARPPVGDDGIAVPKLDDGMNRLLDA